MSSKGGKYIEVTPGIELFIQDIGTGDPIIFIPGFTFTTEVFDKQVAYFSKENRVIVIDPRSHGRSTVTPYGNDYVTHGEDLASVVQTLNLKNVTLVGWSFGCFTIWEYIKQHGITDIKSLVLIDMPPKSLSVNEGDWVEGDLDEIAAIYNTYLRSPEGQREFFTDYSTQVMVQRELQADELNWLVDQSLKTPYYIAGNLFASGMFADYREIATSASQSVPTLTIVAEHWAETAASYIKSVYPGTKIEVLGGHMMFWEYGDKFNGIVDQFLKKST
ncbi:pimeloyl-ACP methyl ester carboxylesterase [Virgibacillus natechei]|uniref:Pimeloyl-ACP methyl ester carboxylesterase n=1 Tax=Virgibacillus natechei TaxID=1216297 RepID=A0ABS4IN19_9BACI|nr:alpha/beta hydrolase [Virgibacillus natechei]MBP1971394.1 pimeloyl-ACP methyl ester carboxylesterase [Virgibacillus natechei]UZD12235.1 alpha/beta hydrolase [Virgibacillus natechei]